MKTTAAWPLLITISVSGCHTLAEPSAGPRDHLVGWYRLPQRAEATRKIIPGHDQLIPIFKSNGAYCSAVAGCEVPLEVCPEGLQLAISPANSAGATIGFDETSKEYYIIMVHKDGQSASWLYPGSGERQRMTKTDKPSCLLDAAADPPGTNDGFLGWYQAVWLPYLAWYIRKDGEKYLAETQAHPGLDLGPSDKPVELTPLTDRLGFTGFTFGNPHVRLTYNEALRRFEFTDRDETFRMPLARVSPPFWTEGGVFPSAWNIGIPFWRH